MEYEKIKGINKGCLILKIIERAKSVCGVVKKIECNYNYMKQKIYKCTKVIHLFPQSVLSKF